MRIGFAVTAPVLRHSIMMIRTKIPLTNIFQSIHWRLRHSIRLRTITDGNGSRVQKRLHSVFTEFTNTTMRQRKVMYGSEKLQNGSSRQAEECGKMHIDQDQSIRMASHLMAHLPIAELNSFEP